MPHDPSCGLAELADRSVDGQMRRHFARAQIADEGFDVVGLVGAERDAAPAGAPVQHEKCRSRSAMPVARVSTASTTKPLQFSIMFHFKI